MHLSSSGRISHGFSKVGKEKSQFNEDWPEVPSLDLFLVVEKEIIQKEERRRILDQSPCLMTSQRISFRSRRKLNRRTSETNNIKNSRW